MAYTLSAPVVRLLGCAVLALGMGLGCTSAPRMPLARGLDYFAPAKENDPWTPKIAGWQMRERRSREGHRHALPPVAAGAGTSVGGTDSLRQRYAAFRSAQRRAGVPRVEVARALADWIQEQARSHYIPDGPIDHWATLEDTLARNGDDCDGLELLVFHALRDLGFGNDRVFRAIVYRPADGQHHMVTLWFQTPDDPWVIDPTGAMTRGLPHMSEVAGWVPLKVFGERGEWTVRPRLAFASR